MTTNFNLRQLEQARLLLSHANQILILTGAGMSAESGVPTFRGEGGYWRNKHFSDLANPEAFAADPKLVWEWYCERRQTVANCEPNAAHYALAAWAKSRPGVRLVTQNVDGLHERAGHPDVIRLHGSLWKNRCTKCNLERDESTLHYETLPLSPCCNVLERPAIVWFGEDLVRDHVAFMMREAVLSDVVLIVGTSGVVQPAATAPRLALQAGKKVIIIDPSQTQLPFTMQCRTTAVDVIPSLLSLT